jgi:putative acetyltransferase
LIHGIMEIRLDTLEDGAVIGLLAEHRREMLSHSPPDCAHALDTAALRKPDLTIWSAWIDGEFAGCGALRELDARHGEIKSMRTTSRQRRKGVAAAILTHIMGVARQRGYGRVSLETGATDHFLAARMLYGKFGFQVCAPFADYRAGPFSVCMTKTLD